MLHAGTCAYNVWSLALFAVSIVIMWLLCVTSCFQLCGASQPRFSTSPCRASAPRCSLHLPLKAEQRAVQNWEPLKGHSALDRILERDAADSVKSRGPLSW